MSWNVDGRDVCPLKVRVSVWYRMYSRWRLELGVLILRAVCVAVGGA